jgi:hypothetical protein
MESPILELENRVIIMAWEGPVEDEKSKAVRLTVSKDFYATSTCLFSRICH